MTLTVAGPKCKNVENRLLSSFSPSLSSSFRIFGFVLVSWRAYSVVVCKKKIVNKSSSLSVVMQAKVEVAGVRVQNVPLATWNKFAAITLIQRAVY